MFLRESGNAFRQTNVWGFFSEKTVSILALIFIWRSFYQQDIHHGGCCLTVILLVGQCCIIGPDKVPLENKNKSFRLDSSQIHKHLIFINWTAFPTAASCLFDSATQELLFLVLVPKKKKGDFLFFLHPVCQITNCQLS